MPLAPLTAIGAGVGGAWALGPRSPTDGARSDLGIYSVVERPIIRDQKTNPRGPGSAPSHGSSTHTTGMTRGEMDHEVDRFLESQKTVPVSLRLPRWVIEQAKSEASRRGIPYQRLLRALIEVGLQPALGRPERPDDD